MKILVLRIAAEDLHCTFFPGKETVELQKTISDYHGTRAEKDFFTRTLGEIRNLLASKPAAVAVRIPFGGVTFPGPAL